MKKTKDQIRYNMQQVKSKNSKIELMLRKALWDKGFRYRKNVAGIYGCPDIAFIGKKVAVFCDSEFWHGFDWENRKKDFKTHQAFWISKIERNMARDKEVTSKLENDGWIVIRFWGKDIKTTLDKCIQIVEEALRYDKKH